jgi:hypothetical protein
MHETEVGLEPFQGWSFLEEATSSISQEALTPYFPPLYQPNPCMYACIRAMMDPKASL